MPKAIARDLCICWHDHMKNREQARSYNFAAPSSEAPGGRLTTTVVDFCSLIQLPSQSMYSSVGPRKVMLGE